jgi:hypothetical protein
MHGGKMTDIPLTISDDGTFGESDDDYQSHRIVRRHYDTRFYLLNCYSSLPMNT